MIRPIVALDTETDSLGPNRKAWEVGLIRRELDGTQRELRMFVRINHSTSDLNSLNIGRYFDRHPEGRKLSGKGPLPGPAGLEPVTSSHDAARRVMEWTFGATIIGAVPDFDTNCLGRLLRAEGFIPAWHHRIRCVETLASGHARRELGGLADCMDALGLDFPQADQHTALGDARAALRVWDAVMGPRQASPAGCGCLTHPDRALSADGDPGGCYCDCTELGLTGCVHGGAS